MSEVEKIKTVDMSGEKVEIVMTKMMRPSTHEELKMTVEERNIPIPTTIKH